VATRPTWAEVSLTTLRQNFRTVQKHVGANVTVCAVVKADAYGHGAVECSRALEAEGARWLGVTSLDEAIPLREAGVGANILLMTGFWRGEEGEIIRLHLTPTVWEPWHIESLDRAAAALGRAQHPVHLKVDTGMGRLGVGLDQLSGLLDGLKSAKHLMLDGLSTHLAASEIMDAPSVAEQERNFDTARRMVEEAGMKPVFVHMANTGAVMERRSERGQAAGEHKISDADIATAAEQVLKWNTLVPRGAIRVTVERGWVTLEGEVEWDYQRRSIQRTISPVTGVRGISHRIALRVKAQVTELSHRIEDALANYTLAQLAERRERTGRVRSGSTTGERLDINQGHAG